MTYLSVTKFHDYQHYTKRRPPWVKFYVKLLEPDNPLMRLPVSTRYLFHMLLLLAAECENSIPNDFEWLVSRLRMPPQDCRDGLEELLKGRWIREKQSRRRASKPASKSASDVLAPESREQRAEKRLSSSSVVDTNEPADFNNLRDEIGKLSDERWFHVERILTSTKGVDAESHRIVQFHARQVNLATLADIAGRARGQHIGWAVEALKGEARERTTA